MNNEPRIQKRLTNSTYGIIKTIQTILNNSRCVLPRFPFLPTLLFFLVTFKVNVHLSPNKTYLYCLIQSGLANIKSHYTF